MTPLELDVPRLGPSHIPSPMSGIPFVDDGERVLYHSTLKEAKTALDELGRMPSFEMAGPRKTIYFDPGDLRCGIVTCGGICPGLNDVIRALVMSLHYHYGVKAIYGFRYGYEGLSARYRHTAMTLTPREVRDIHLTGGTILGSSRGPQDIAEMVDTLEEMNVGILFTLGGDGTLKGAQALCEEIDRRKAKISVIGIPKTIDNDISHLDKSFGFETAVAQTRSAIYSAHVEALGARNGIGLVKLMGRESGFIAAYAVLACSDANFCLVPELNFTLDGLLRALKTRLEMRQHAVIVVAEGAGQDLAGKTGEVDLSGNVRLQDIGHFLRDRIIEYFKKAGWSITLKYIDPSYTIRSMPANPHDSVFCLMLGHNAVHAGMTGRTNMLVGHWNGAYTHVPIPLAVSKRKRIDPDGRFWSSVLESTGQPRDLS
ncbi:MAG: ATP-dependent 6-phosphofructokinase [Deltaproteobacteria bacterium]|nr:ATP-dependent 6-phosphofructokinase [Deltaproteobacteria bacterium]